MRGEADVLFKLNVNFFDEKKFFLKKFLTFQKKRRSSQVSRLGEADCE